MYRKRLAVWFALAAMCALVAPSANAFENASRCAGYQSTCFTFTTPNNSLVEPEIAIAFWGNTASDWAPGAQAFGRSQIVAAVQSVVNGPYFAAMNQPALAGSGFIGMPRMAPLANVILGPAPNSGGHPGQGTYSEVDLVNIIKQAINAYQLPKPISTRQMVYIIFVPEGDYPSDCGPAPGCNYGSGNDLVAEYNGYQYVLATVGGISTAPDGDVVQTFTHEAIEAISRYENVFATGPCSPGTQISDVCECNISEPQSGGFPLATYWSPYDNACVIPESWGALEVTSGVGGRWQTYGDFGVVYQASGGAGGVATTRHTFYNGAHYWTYFQRPGNQPQVLWAGVDSQLVAGGNYVAWLDGDVADGVQLYSLTSQTQTTLPLLPSGQLITSVLLTSAGRVVVTDSLGQPWYYSPIHSWEQIGYAGDQFVASEDTVLALTTDHIQLGQYPGSGAGWDNGGYWQNLGSSSQYWDIVASPDTPYWGTVAVYPYDAFLAAYGDFNIGQTDWAGTQFGVANGNQAALSTYSMAEVYVESSALNSWSNLNSGNIGRLVSGGSVWATQCVGGPQLCVSY